MKSSSWNQRPGSDHCRARPPNVNLRHHGGGYCGGPPLELGFGWVFMKSSYFIAPSPWASFNTMSHSLIFSTWAVSPASVGFFRFDDDFFAAFFAAFFGGAIRYLPWRFGTAM